MAFLDSYNISSQKVIKHEIEFAVRLPSKDSRKPPNDLAFPQVEKKMRTRREEKRYRLAINQKGSFKLPLNGVRAHSH